MRKPLCIDLFCGLGGWTEGFLAEGYDVVGFDIEHHVYGQNRYPAQLVLQDVRTIHGSQFREAACIVASSPCQEFSYRAMPWKRAKALPPPYFGMELFAQAARIQREASEAAGRHIPMIQENVRGAQKWVGRAQWHYGSYYLWGDVPALMPVTHKARKVPGLAPGHFPPGGLAQGAIENATKNGGNGSWFFGNAATGGDPARGVSVGEAGTKNTGGSWFAVAHNTTSGHSKNPVHQADQYSGSKGFTLNGEPLGKNSLGRRHGSKSKARKAASAAIAKIPFPLASHIARTFYPHEP